MNYKSRKDYAVAHFPSDFCSSCGNRYFD
ncbi:YgiT-type zinc finger protein [Dialister invisus]